MQARALRVMLHSDAQVREYVCKAKEGLRYLNERDRNQQKEWQRLC